MTAGKSYSEYVRPSTHVMRIGRLQPGELTPLVEVVAPRIDRLPGDLQAQLKREFWKRHNASDEWDNKYAAQDWLAQNVAELERERLSIAFDDTEIKQRAERAAGLCARMGRVDVMADHARSLGIEPPTGKRITRVGAAKRLSCPRWWRRQLRKHYTRRAEVHLRRLGIVHRRRQVYASDRAVAWRRGRKCADRALLQELLAVSNEGDQLNLFEIVERSQANPALRRAELMTRLRGFDEVAQYAGHAAEFITLTAPSAFHRMHANGTQNEKWEGHSPRDAQAWLSKQWARVRAKLQRLSIRIYGFRIAEPHHDGTPHWHVLAFVPAHHLDALRSVIAGAWLSEYGDEAGAQKYRVKFEAIDRAKGSAVGYLSKYIAKNIDGFEVGDDYETECAQATETCDRVAAWASAHGIRQFQQIGGPSVTVWRELRRIRDCVDASPAIEAARKAADAGEWAEFVTALGGIERSRSAPPVVLWKETTGELSQYDELRPPIIAGVDALSYRRASFELPSIARRVRKVVARRWCYSVPHRDGRVRTRVKCWRIERKASGNVAGVSARASDFASPVSSLGPVSITVRAAHAVPSPASAGAHVRGPPWMH